MEMAFALFEVMHFSERDTTNAFFEWLFSRR